MKIKSFNRRDLAANSLATLCAKKIEAPSFASSEFWPSSRGDSICKIVSTWLFWKTEPMPICLIYTSQIQHLVNVSPRQFFHLHFRPCQKKFNGIFNLIAVWNTTTRCSTTWKRKRWRTWWLPVKTLGCRTLSFSVDLLPSWEKGKLRQLIAGVGHVLEGENRRKKSLEAKGAFGLIKVCLLRLQQILCFLLISFCVIL